MLGIKLDVSNHLAFVDDTDVIYPAGHSIVRVDCDSKAQRLVQASIGSQGITAMAMSPSKRCVLRVPDVVHRSPSPSSFLPSLPLPLTPGVRPCFSKAPPTEVFVLARDIEIVLLPAPYRFLLFFPLLVRICLLTVIWSLGCALGM